MIFALSLSFLIQIRSSVSSRFQTFTRLSSPVHRLDGSTSYPQPCLVWCQLSKKPARFWTSIGKFWLLWAHVASRRLEVYSEKPPIHGEFRVFSWSNLQPSTECKAQCFIHCTAGLTSLAPRLQNHTKYLRILDTPTSFTHQGGSWSMTYSPSSQHLIVPLRMWLILFRQKGTCSEPAEAIDFYFSYTTLRTHPSYCWTQSLKLFMSCLQFPAVSITKEVKTSQMEVHLISLSEFSCDIPPV